MEMFIWNLHLQSYKKLLCITTRLKASTLAIKFSFDSHHLHSVYNISLPSVLNQERVSISMDFKKADSEMCWVLLKDTARGTSFSPFSTINHRKLYSTPDHSSQLQNMWQK